MFEIVMWPVAKATSCVADAVSSVEPEEREHHSENVVGFTTRTWQIYSSCNLVISKLGLISFSISTFQWILSSPENVKKALFWQKKPTTFLID